jgi:hypothetical protein
MNSSTPVALSAAPGRASSGDFWRKIERFLKARTLVPVLGPGVITFGDNDQLLYPWVTAQIASKLELDPVPPNMHELVCAHLRNNGRVEDVCIEIDELLDSPALEAGSLLKSLASVAQCRLFLTLGFDPLMERALNLLRGAGRPITRTWCFSLDRESLDLPNPAGSRALLGYLFGNVSPNPGYLLWDAIEFVWQLQRQLPALNTLGRTLSENNLVILGTSLPDWLVRFLLRAIRQRPFTEGSGKNFLLAGCEPPSQADAVVFYESLRRGIHVLPVEPLSFAREFCRRAHAQESPLTSGVVPGTNLAIPLMDPVMPDGRSLSVIHTPRAMPQPPSGSSRNCGQPAAWSGSMTTGLSVATTSKATWKMRYAAIAGFSSPSSPARPRAGASRTTTRSVTGQPNASSR